MISATARCLRALKGEFPEKLRLTSGSAKSGILNEKLVNKNPARPNVRQHTFDKSFICAFCIQISHFYNYRFLDIKMPFPAAFLSCLAYVWCFGQYSVENEQTPTLPLDGARARDQASAPSLCNSFSLWSENIKKGESLFSNGPQSSSSVYKRSFPVVIFAF